MQLGDLMAIVTLLVTVGAIAAYVTASKDGREQVLSLGRTAYLASTTAIAAMSVYFMWLILGNRFELEYIFNNSSVELPLIYKISVFWAGQQGSFLFWALCSGLLGIWVMLRAKEFEPWLMAFWSAVQGLFLVMLLIDSPFRLLPPEMQVQISNGQGLRELLQNPWMAIHPPLVFIGYAAMCVPAAFAVAGLITGNVRSWCRVTLPWAIFGWITLGSGIIVGAYWAYEVLGWGGYWGWDPVENASLIPWLTGTALLHGMLAERYRGTFKRTNVALALITFLLVFYATFLTRSNALGEASVHTFGDARIGTPLLYFMATGLLVFIGLSVWRWRSIQTAPSFTSLVSKDYLFFLAIALFMLSAAFVLTGTSMPIFYKLASGAQQVQEGMAQAQQVKGVDPSHYNKVNTPIALFILALMALAPVLPWRREKEGVDPQVQQGLGVIIAAVLVGIPFAALHPILKEEPNLAEITTYVAMAAVVIAAIAGLAMNIRAIAASRRNGIRLLGGYAAHVGMGIMFVGVIISATGGPSKTLVLAKGEKPTEIFGYKLSYEGTKNFSDRKAGLQIKVERKGRVEHAIPTMQLTRDNQVMSSPHIVTSIMGDLYIAPKSVPGSEQKNVSKGKSVPVQDFDLKFVDFVMSGHDADETRIGAKLEAIIDGKKVTATPFIVAKRQESMAGLAVPVPGMDVTIGIDRIRVEDKAIDVTLTPNEGEPQSMTLIREQPQSAGGFTLLFKSWDLPEGDHSDHMQVGANVQVTRGGKTVTVQPTFSPSGGGSGDITVSEPVVIPGGDTTVALTAVNVNTGQIQLTLTPTVEATVVDVSRKPMMSLVWIGSLLALIGGGVAMWRRSVDGWSDHKGKSPMDAEYEPVEA